MLIVACNGTVLVGMTLYMDDSVMIIRDDVITYCMRVQCIMYRPMGTI